MNQEEAGEIQQEYNRCAGPATMDRKCGHADGYLEVIGKAKGLEEGYEELLEEVSFFRKGIEMETPRIRKWKETLAKWKKGK